MEGSRKTQKLKRADKKRNSDRISALHDSIIYHIFSFLPTIYVVQTSVLSKRWQKLWIDLPYLYFDDEYFTGANGIEHSVETTRTKFTHFVDNFLFRRAVNSPIIKFRLTTSCELDGFHTNVWISSAVRAGVKELDVCINGDIGNHMDYSFSCPSYLFNNRTSLVTLKLSFDDTLIHFPEYFCFPNLKGMHLHSVSLAKNFPHQLLNCPNLESLYLDDFLVEADDLPVSYTFQHSTDGHHSAILSNLVDAYIGEIYVIEPFGEHDLRIATWLGTLIRKLSNVKTLHLGFSNIKLLQYSEAWRLNVLPTFCNLKHLDLEVGNGFADVVEVVTCLVKRSPVLQSLHLKYVFAYESPWNWHGTQKLEEFISVCLLGKLKKITMYDFCGKTKEHIEVLRVFLRVKRLEEIIIHLDKSRSNDLILLKQELLQLSRPSKLVLLDETDKKIVSKEIFQIIPS
ncbi:hypothetical protein ACOSP7_030675 [Xanthoceras sorbifolium]